MIPRRHFIAASAAAATLPAAQSIAAGREIESGHGVAMHGVPKYKDGFTHFDYVNPGAPKGGSLYLGAGGSTFDSLNPFIIRGTPAATVSGFVFDRLMKRADDEAFSLYALVARRIAMPKDRSWVEFELDARARFHDGSPITVEDVMFSLEILRTKGRPFFRSYFRDVTKVEKIGERGVKFTFRPGENRELPLIVAGDLPILSRRFWQSRDFERASLERPLGSGPYRIGAVTPGTRIEYERVKDYWAAALPVNRGYNNFDVLRVEYFRDATIGREAFKAGDYDYHPENQATAWATAYDVPAVSEGLLNKRALRHERPAGMQAFIFNTRRPQFRDWRLRRALAHVFDFEWTNRNIFFGQYVRTKSFFANSEMAATGLPEGEERKVLEPLRGRIPDTVFKEPYDVPRFDGEGNIRDGMREGLALLKAAGWEIRDFKLVHAQSGEPLRFELMTSSPQFERIFLPYIRNLKRIGIDARMRLVDPSQYVKRIQKFDFDIIMAGWGQSESPGNEQRDYWGSAAAATDASTNYSGIADKALDELIELVIAAPDRDSLVARTKALDRVLLHQHFVVPAWHINTDRILWWDKFGAPPPTRRGTSVITWWFDPARAERLKGRIRSLDRAIN